MQEQKENHIKRLSFISTLSLFFQTGYAATLGLVANLILTILLSPTVFGIYITVLSIISFLNYFSDVGLAASIIQKKELTKEDIATTFTTQQLLIIAVIGLGFFATGFIRNFYNLPPDGIYLYWALLFSFFISSLKTIPSVFLERKIQFQKIVFVQVIENTVFYITVSILALSGFGLMSFTVAVFLRAVTGLILIYIISPWVPRIGISFTHLKGLLSFGIPFQASSFLALFKDDLIILYLGKVLGFEALGFIGWAKKWADAPIRIVMDNISRVIFPLIARFQDNVEKVKNLAEKILYYQTIALAPIVVGMAVVMKYVIDVIPNYHKWQPALPLFYIFILSSLLISFSAPFMNLYNALGKVKITFSFMIFFTALMWTLTPYFTHLFGSYGFPLAHIIVSVSYFAILALAKKQLQFNFFRSIYKPLLASLLMGVAVLLGESFFSINSLLSLGLLVGSGILIYYFILAFVFRVSIRGEIKSFLEVKK